MNTIAIDIGNTNITIGYAEEKRWIIRKILANIRQRSSDECAVLIREFFRTEDIAVDCVALCSVVPQVNDNIISALQSVFTIPPIVIHHALKHSLKSPIPAEMGNDLFANAVAAHTYERDCIIVDAGTALTFTAVSKQGEIRGVSIFPGMRSAIQSLSSNTAQLPVVDLASADNALGKNTSTAIQGGISLGYTGVLREITNNMKKQMSDDTLIIGTGGDIAIHSAGSLFSLVDPWHTLTGIRLIAEMNMPAQ